MRERDRDRDREIDLPAWITNYVNKKFIEEKHNECLYIMDNHKF